MGNPPKIPGVPTEDGVLVVGLLQLLQALSQHVPELVQAKLLTQQGQLGGAFVPLPSLRTL